MLQWVNPIFRPAVHFDIEAVTARIQSQGLTTPRLVRRPGGELWVADAEDGGCWRVLTWIDGRTLHRISSAADAAEAGALVGRFHRALHGWTHAFHFARPEAHDTLHHMRLLRESMERCSGHALEVVARTAGAEILDRWGSWEGTLELPERVCHGDLKISNVRFAAGSDEAVCLIDLDTLANLPLAVEMGDAWRSWCNPAGEDDPDAVRFDMALFESSARAWLAHAPPLESLERDSLAAGIERICLELAARFCADAVRNSYFREDRTRFPAPGQHNLHRSRGQLALARSARECRAACERILRAG